MKHLASIALILGIMLIIAGIIFLLLIFGPVIKEEVKYAFSNAVTKQKEQEGKIIPIDEAFGIVIPKIRANARIIKNVNPRDEKVYQRALTKGVAHARGSSLPGEAGNIFLFAHSSDNFYNANRYNSIFYLLTKLEKGDSIDLYYGRKKYAYKVDKKNIVSAESIQYMSGVSKTNTLTLMTCWPPGTTLKRLVIQANPAK